MANPFKNLPKFTPGDTKHSIAWYRKQVYRLGDMQRKVARSLAQGQGDVDIGGLYLFKYDPKWKEELPYYDTLPLVFPFAPAEGGFLGLNLHYLPYGARFKLMSALIDLTIEVSDPKKRKEISWALLSRSSKFVGVEACVKHYLSDHVQTQFLSIPLEEWLSAAMLPVERFKKASKEEVFRQSRKMY